MNKETIAYAAGFIDGEGCFYLGFRRGNKGRRCFPCTITVAQTSHGVLQFLAKHFGGKCYPVKPRRTKLVWQWSVYGDDADKFIRLVIPYLRVKRRQAKVFIKMRRLINANAMGKRIRADELAKRIAIVREMKILNRRGVFQRPTEI